VTDEARARELLRRWRPGDDVDEFDLVQCGRVLMPPAPGRSLADRVEGNASLVAASDVVVDDAEFWAHFRRQVRRQVQP
jgi:hypothetical protein